MDGAAERYPGGAAAAKREPRGFDGGLAGHPTRELPVAEVVDLLELTHAADRIREYRERMRAGDLFPPAPPSIEFP
jgi:hypothetical protein